MKVPGLLATFSRFAACTETGADAQAGQDPMIDAVEKLDSARSVTSAGGIGGTVQSPEGPQPRDDFCRFPVTVTAIFNGDFTPMRRAEVESTTLKFPDGHELTTNTVETTGLNSIYIERSVKKKNQKVGRRTRTEGILGTETECNGPHPWRD